MSIINKLTEGIVRRDLSKEGTALLNKWEKTGLLEGLTNERTKQGMAALLENQAKELLRESSSMSALGAGGLGDVEGFASVAFPIVRRVFGGLIANDLVSVQPMSLPSGLIFFLDFTLDRNRLDMQQGDSVYGGGVVASQITGGVVLTSGDAEQGFYALNNGYSSPTGSAPLNGTVGTPVFTVDSGTIGTDAAADKAARFDPDIAAGQGVAWASIALSSLSATLAGTLVSNFNIKDLVTVTLYDGTGAVIDAQVRRLTRDDYDTAGNILLVCEAATAAAAATALTSTAEAKFVIDDGFTDGNAIGSVSGIDIWGLEGNPNIPEIDIKVDSVAVTAKTKKLKAKWTPELAQDLNAYHNLDAEVELTSILSEHIALEIDQEILEDLVKGATAATLYWSRLPGKFVNRETGLAPAPSPVAAYPDFTGNVSEWYETLAETINDVSAQIHRKTLRGGANFVVCSPEVANILEFTAGFRGSVTHDDDRGEIGAVKVGSLSKKFDVYVDPYFPRNVVLVGRKGSSFLESGYVYAPYVPLQMTPTIFGTEDFVPRKGVMTRYAKKMVRPDMYGLVIVEDLGGNPVVGP